jgi:hypothetical protein
MEDACGTRQSHHFRNRGYKCISTHDTHYATPYHCRFRNYRYDCIGAHDVHYAADYQSRVAMCPQRQGLTAASTAKVKF